MLNLSVISKHLHVTASCCHFHVSITKLKSFSLLWVTKIMIVRKKCHTTISLYFFTSLILRCIAVLNKIIYLVFPKCVETMFRYHYHVLNFISFSLLTSVKNWTGKSDTYDVSKNKSFVCIILLCLNLLKKNISLSRYRSWKEYYLREWWKNIM